MELAIRSDDTLSRWCGGFGGVTWRTSRVELQEKQMALGKGGIQGLDGLVLELA